jgi:hypothetical protein
MQGFFASCPIAHYRISFCCKHRVSNGMQELLVLCVAACMLLLLLPSPHPFPTLMLSCSARLRPRVVSCHQPQPAVAFANVGELAVDVLVCTLKAQLAARLDDENLLACAGNNAYSMQPPGLLATALELYQVPGGSMLCAV